MKQALLISIIWVSGLCHAAGAPELLRTHWRYLVSRDQNEPDRAAAWRANPLPCVRFKGQPEDSLWLSGQLPATTTFQNPTLYIRGVGVPFRAFVGGKKIYEFGYEGDKPSQRFLGIPWHLIHLPPHSAGLEIRFLTRFWSSKSGICTEIYFGEADQIAEKLATDGLDCTATAIFGLLLGLAGIGVAIATRTWKPYLAFSGYALSVAAWIYGNSSGPASRLFLVHSARFWSFVELTGLYLTPVFLGLFFRQITQAKTLGLKVLQGIQWVHLLFAAVVIPLGIFDVIHLGQTLPWYNRFIPVFLLTLTWQASARLKSTHSEEQIFALGVLMFLGFGIHDFLSATGVLLWRRHLAQYGLAALLICLAWIATQIFKRQMSERTEFERQAEISALLAEKAKSALHDIKTPMSSLGGKIDSLESVSQEMKNAMKANLSRMRAILGSQFDETTRKMEAQNSSMSVEGSPPTTSLAAILANVNEDLAPIAHSAGVEWDLVIPKWASRAFVDISSTDLIRVIQNLSQNAVHAALERDKRVMILLERLDDRVQITVRDFGLGFSDQALQAFREGVSFTAKPDGHGRGLISTQQLLKTVGGSLSILSDPSGTVATVEVPLALGSTDPVQISGDLRDGVTQVL